MRVNRIELYVIGNIVRDIFISIVTEEYIASRQFKIVIPPHLAPLIHRRKFQFQKYYKLNTQEMSLRR